MPTQPLPIYFITAQIKVAPQDSTVNSHGTIVYAAGHHSASNSTQAMRSFVENVKKCREQEPLSKFPNSKMLISVEGYEASARADGRPWCITHMYI